MDEREPESPSTVQMDLFIDQVQSLVTRMDELLKHDKNSNVTTVVHKTAGIGPWAAAAVTACFLTFLGLILFALVVIPELHDQKAWIDIFRSKIYVLEGKK